MPNITPTTPAVFYGFNEQIVEVPIVTLTTWAVAMRALLKTGTDVTGKDIKSVVYRHLECPDDYPLEAVVDHLNMVMEQTKDFYGIGGNTDA